MQSEINKLNFNLKIYSHFIKHMDLTDDLKEYIQDLKKSKELER